MTHRPDADVSPSGLRPLAILCALAALTVSAVVAFNPQPDPPMPVDKISSSLLITSGQRHLPLADLARALGSRGFEHDESKNLYTVVPGRGLLTFNPGGVSRLGRVAPVTGRLGQKVRPPALGVLAIQGHIVSRGIVTVNNTPYLPLEDLAQAMNREVAVQGDGSVVLILPAAQKVQKVAPPPALLGVSP